MGARNIGKTGNMGNMGNISSDHSLFAGQSDATGANGETRPFLMRPFPTLGEQMAREARRIVSRRIPTFSWLRPLETVVEHLTSLPVPSQERFQRTEAPADPIVFPSPGAAASGAGGDNPLMAFEQMGMQRRRAETAWQGQPMWQGQPTPQGQPTSQGEPLSPHIQQRLQNFVGRGTEAIRIHDDEASHALAQAQRADAVTVGSHIFFGQDRFRPQKDEGFALLTHEALHVVQAMQPGRAWRRATQVGIQEEEQEAVALESQALHARRNASWGAQARVAPLRSARSQPLAGPATSRVLGAPTVATEGTPAAPAQQPMRAATNRSLEDGVVSQPAMPSIDELKRILYRDLMRQIKAELERGG